MWLCKSLELIYNDVSLDEHDHMSGSSCIAVFIGGTQKSGTRSLSSYFRKHPKLALHKAKEGHFFDKELNFCGHDVKPERLNDFIASFESDEQSQMLCDATPDYIFRAGAIERIKKYNPYAHWIILLRNPIERAFSAWNMEVSRKAENLTFDDALVAELNNETTDRKHDRYRYIGRSMYMAQIKKLLRFFPEEQCQFIQAEALWLDPEPILQNMFDKLPMGIQANGLYHRKHKGLYRSEISTHARGLLRKVLHSEINELPSFLGWEKNFWV